eukprot:4983999-Prymnesium_polylepis.1
MPDSERQARDKVTVYSNSFETGHIPYNPYATRQIPAVGRGSAPLPAGARAELEDVVVATSPCRRFRRRRASHSSSVCSGRREASFYTQVGPQDLRRKTPSGV